jgi:hypothetical protein
MYWDMQDVLGHAAWIWTRRTDLDMQHGHLFQSRLMKGPQISFYPPFKYIACLHQFRFVAP